jgi:ATP-dependent Clp protease, protease subunit
MTDNKTSYYSFVGFINDDSVRQICEKLATAANGDYAVHLSITSRGGVVASAMHLFSFIRALPVPVTIHNTGQISSAALIVFLAGQRRTCSRYAAFMHHPSAFSSERGMLVNEAAAQIEAMKSADLRTDDILRDQCSTFPEQLMKEAEYRDVNISAEDALEYGIVHEVCEFKVPRDTIVWTIGTEA